MTPTEIVKKLNLSVRYEFVPFKHSRFRDDKQCNLNWRATLLSGEKEVITIDYSAGQAWCPAFQRKDKYLKKEMIQMECESGKQVRYSPHTDSVTTTKKDIIPNDLDVLHALVNDIDVVNYGTFEGWCNDLGYNPDSMKDEKIYLTCVAHALRLRKALGDDALHELREAFQDY